MNAEWERREGMGAYNCRACLLPLVEVEITLSISNTKRSIVYTAYLHTTISHYIKLVLI